MRIIEVVKNAIIARLTTLYPDLPVYEEEPGEEAAKPAFYVRLASSLQERETGRRFRRTLTYDLQYLPLPDSSDRNAQIEQIVEQLYEQLATVSYDGATFRTYDMRHESTDTAMHFYLSVDIALMRAKPAEPIMQQYTQEGSLR